MMVSEAIYTTTEDGHVTEVIMLERLLLSQVVGSGR